MNCQVCGKEIVGRKSTAKYCLDCAKSAYIKRTNQRRKARRLENPEEVRAKDREYYMNHQDKRTKYSREYRAKERATEEGLKRHREYMRQWRAAHHEHALAYNREYCRLEKEFEMYCQ